MIVMMTRTKNMPVEKNLGWFEVMSSIPPGHSPQNRFSTVKPISNTNNIDEND